MKKNIQLLFSSVVLSGVVLFVFLLQIPVFALVMSSTNYRMQSDSINFGGSQGTSTNFIMEDSLGETGTGISSSTHYYMSAGFEQIDGTYYLSMTAPISLAMLPNIPGLTGGSSSSTAEIGMVTDNPAGYSLIIQTTTNPALKSGANSFANYTLSSSIPDLDWQVGSSASEFGFNPSGTDVVTRYKNSAGQCDTGGGSSEIDKCWDVLTVAERIVSQTLASNYPDTSTTTIKFKAESGSLNKQPIGTYQTTVVVTGVMN